MNVAFYSYKGGVGRTQLVANLASYLYLYENKKVLLMDWDLEAPGLHFYFQKPNENRNFQNSDFKSEGLLEVLQSYIRMVRSENPKEIKKEDLPRFEAENIVSLAQNHETGAKIDMIPAGIYENFTDYRRKVIDFNWFEFYEMLDGGRYLELVIKPQISTELGYDFVLIDSRTGISDYQNISNIQMADANIIVIAPNMQNLEGCVAVAKSIIDSPYVAEGRRKPVVMPVLSRAEEDSPDFPNFNETFKQKTKFIIDKLNQYLPIVVEDNYYEKTRLFYNKFIAIGEHSLFEKKENELPRFQTVFRNIADYLLAYFIVDNKDINKLVEFSDENLRKNNLTDAEKALDRALEIQPDTAIMVKLAKIYQKQNQLKKAVALIEKGLKKYPNDEILKQQKYTFMNLNIKKALSALQDANYSGYFEAMDKTIPENLLWKFSELRMQFIAGDTTWKFAQQLESFAKVVEKDTQKAFLSTLSERKFEALLEKNKFEEVYNLLQEAGYSDSDLESLKGEMNNRQIGLKVLSDQQLKDLLQYSVKKMFADMNKSQNIANISGDGNTVIQGVENSTVTVGNNTASKSKPTEILFISANPEQEGRLAIDKEYREIDLRLRTAGKRDLFDLKKPLLAVTIDDLLRELSTQQPQIIHFAGHGTQTSILISNDQNKPIPLPKNILLRFLKKQNNLKLLILNCCFSEDLAIDISKELPNLYITGMNYNISDIASIAFAAGIYIRMGEGVNMEAAFEGGLIKVEMEHSEEKHIPTLWKNGTKIVI